MVRLCMFMDYMRIMKYSQIKVVYRQFGYGYQVKHLQSLTLVSGFASVSLGNGIIYKNLRDFQVNCYYIKF